MKLFRWESIVNHSIHHIPGRLRVRVHSMKGCAEKARAIQRKILAEHGVRSADVNLLTGSILIRYNPRDCEVGRLLASLGLSRSAVNRETYMTTRHRIGEKILKKFANYALEIALERAALALVAAIL